MELNQAWDLIAMLAAWFWNKLTTFELFGFVLWKYALFAIALAFAGHIAVRIIQNRKD